ncbi:DNA polymerase I [Radicibacter daui]|uniref:DNA polymerase I n=1 Tax=Radicibacter daui TaxID=3064829 RepID=UPI004046A5F4
MSDLPETAQSGAAPADAGPTTLYLVDGSGFIFRAFHSLPPMTRPDGTPVNAVYGFTNMLMKLLRDHHAHHLAVIFDAKRENFRNEFYPDYKAHRPPAPEELVPQFPIIHECVRAFDLPCIEMEGYEADDLIATYARLARERGWHVTVVSSDKDLMQLVRDGVDLFDPMKNKAIGPDEVFEKFGVAPDRVVDVQSLAGDSVDNVPGVPGIGLKTAAQLITEYGDLDALLERAGEIKQPKRRESLIEHAEMARISRRLVQLDAHAPVTEGLDELTAKLKSDGKLVSFLEEQGFRSIVSKLGVDGTAQRASAPKPMPAAGKSAGNMAGAEEQKLAGPHATITATPDRSAYELVQDEEALARWVTLATKQGRVAVDTETDSLRASTARLVGVSLALAPGKACYIPLGHAAAPEGGLDFSADKPKQIEMGRAIALLKPLLEDPGVLKIGHNLKYDWQVLAQHGIDIAPWDDTMLMHYCVSGRGRGNSLDDVSEALLGHTTIKFEDVCGKGKGQIGFAQVPLEAARDYAAEDADVTWCLWEHLTQKLLTSGKKALYETVERPLTRVVARMETAGILVDREHLKRLSQSYGERMVALEGEVHKLAGEPFNLGSPKQLGDILFGKLGLQGGRKGKTGAYSTDVSVLEPLALEHEVVARLLEWRHVAKLKSTYTDALQEEIEQATGRVHTSFAITATSTGRFSSTDPNLQNIPTRDEEGKRIRRAFIAPEGMKLLSVDYSQIELRLAAEMAGVEALKQAFRDKVDIHALTASQVFNVPMAEMTSEIRRRAKAINFGIIYGISGFGLGQQLGIGTGEAQSFITAYFARFPEIRDFMEETKTFARANGYVTTLFGRRCEIDGIQDKNPARRSGAERQAINAPIQGSAADLLKRAMARVPGALEKAGLAARMLLTVHDELVFEVPDAELEATSALVRQVMEGAAAPALTLSVPLVAEAGAGTSWADAH